MSMLITWLVLALSVWITALIVPGISVKGFSGAIVVAAIFGILNWAIGWLLFVMIGLGTLGVGFLLAFLTRWIVTALLLKLTSAFTERIFIRNFGWAFLAAMVMSALGTIGEYLLAHQSSFGHSYPV